MSKRAQQYAAKAITNWLNQIVTICVGIFLMPYAINKLGKDAFGIYSVVASVLGFFVFLDMGISVSIVRFASQAFSRNDKKRLTQTSSASFVLLGGLGLVGGIIIASMSSWLARFFSVPLDMVKDMGMLVSCLGATFFLRLLNNVPRGLMLGANRYEAVNIIDIIANLLRLVCLVLLFEFFKPSLANFGISFLIPQLVRISCLSFLAKRALGKARLFSFSVLQWNVFRMLFGFSILNFLSIIGNSLMIQGPSFAIGKFLGLSMAAYFAPAILVASTLRSFIGSLCSPLVPLASQDVADSGGKKLGSWAIRLGQFSCVFALAIVLPLCIYSREILLIWLGSDFVWTAGIMIVIALSMVLASVQSPTYYLALGGGSIMPIAVSYLVMGVSAMVIISVGMAWLDWGLMAVSICLGAMLCLRNIFYIPFAYAKLFGYSVSKYLINVYLLPIVAAATATMISLIIYQFSKPKMPIVLLLHIAMCEGIYGYLVWKYVLSQENKQLLRGIVPGLFAKLGL